MEGWVRLLEDSPYVAIIIALASVVIYLFRSRDKLQTKYTNDLVQAISTLQSLTAEYLKQSFTDSANWQERYSAFEGTFKKHVDDDLVATDRILTELEKTEARLKEHFDHLTGMLSRGQ